MTDREGIMPEQSSFFQRPVSGILGAAALLLLWSFPAMAAMHLDVPARAARGDGHPRAGLR